MFFFSGFVAGLVNENVDLPPSLRRGASALFGCWEPGGRFRLRAFRGRKTNAPTDRQWEGGGAGRRCVSAPHRTLGAFQRNKWIEEDMSSPGNET